MRKPRVYEVYMYEKFPYVVYNTGYTWIHGHPYVKLVGAGLGGTKHIKLMYHDWDKLTPVLTRDGEYTYHSFRFKQHDVPGSKLL